MLRFVVLASLLLAQVVADGSNVAPRHIRLAAASTPELLHVSWTSDAPVSDCSAKVHYGATATALTETAEAVCTTYSITDMCESPANLTSHWADPGTLHDAVLNVSTLAADSTVFYQVDGSTTVYTATRQAPVDNVTYPYSFVSFGDLGVAGNANDFPFAADSMAQLEAMVQSKSTSPINFVLHVGDIAYAGGNGSKWAEFMTQIEPVTSKIPWMVSPGNHDTLCSGNNLSLCSFLPPWPLYLKVGGASGECGVPYDKQFFMPGLEAKTRNRWYSFDSGPLHVTVLSSEDDMREGSDQHKFLAADLAAARARSPDAWLVVAFHRPLHGSSVVELAPERPFFRKALEPVLLANHVDLFLSGHVHQYQRSRCRISGLAVAKCDKDGIVHATIGMAGPPNQNKWMPFTKNMWAQSFDHGVARFDVLNATHLRGSFSSSTTNELVDEFYVVKGEAAVQGLL